MSKFKTSVGPGNILTYDGDRYKIVLLILVKLLSWFCLAFNIVCISLFVFTSVELALVPIAVVKVVAKFGSFPRAVAYSFNVSKLSGAALLKFVLRAFDSAFVYDVVELAFELINSKLLIVLTVKVPPIVVSPVIRHVPFISIV